MSATNLRATTPVNASQVLRAAWSGDFKRHDSKESWMNADSIGQEVEELFMLLEARDVPFLLVGGLAMLTHVRGRNTDDVDLIISVPDQRRLEPEVALVDPPAPGSPFALGRYKGLRVDYLDAGASIFRLVLEKHREEQPLVFASGTSRRLPVATPRGLMLLKLFALPSVTRQMDWERATTYEDDVLRLWLAHPELDPRQVLPTLKPHLDANAFYSLENEVLPDVIRRRERYTRGGTGPAR